MNSVTLRGRVPKQPQSYGRRWASCLLGCAIACASIGGGTPAVAHAQGEIELRQEVDQLQSAELAITVDDLPAHSAAHPGMTRLDIAAEMIAALQGAGAPPTYGFANGTPMEWDPAVSGVLHLWRDAGFFLANHTFSHLDLAQVSAQTFFGDIEKMDGVLTRWVSASSLKLFRYPYLSDEFDSIRLERRQHRGQGSGR